MFVHNLCLVFFVVVLFAITKSSYLIRTNLNVPLVTCDFRLQNKSCWCSLWKDDYIGHTNTCNKHSTFIIINLYMLKWIWNIAVLFKIQIINFPCFWTLLLRRISTFTSWSVKRSILVKFSWAFILQKYKKMLIRIIIYGWLFQR